MYVLAEAAYRGMLIEQKQQAILISGESGAGKTEGNRQLMNYLIFRGSMGGSGPSDLTDKIMNANPILERCARNILIWEPTRALWDPILEVCV